MIEKWIINGGILWIKSKLLELKILKGIVVFKSYFLF